MRKVPFNGVLKTPTLLLDSSLYNNIATSSLFLAPRTIIINHVLLPSPLRLPTTSLQSTNKHPNRQNGSPFQSTDDEHQTNQHKRLQSRSSQETIPQMLRLSPFICPWSCCCLYWRVHWYHKHLILRLRRWTIRSSIIQQLGGRWARREDKHQTTRLHTTTSSLHRILCWL